MKDCPLGSPLLIWTLVCSKQSRNVASVLNNNPPAMRWRQYVIQKNHNPLQYSYFKATIVRKDGDFNG